MAMYVETIFFQYSSIRSALFQTIDTNDGAAVGGVAGGVAGDVAAPPGTDVSGGMVNTNANDLQGKTSLFRKPSKFLKIIPDYC